MSLGGEAKRKHDTVVALRCLARALERLHEARVLLQEHWPGLAGFGSVLILGLESWVEDIEATLKPH